MYEDFKVIPVDQPFNYPPEEIAMIKEKRRSWATKFCPSWALLKNIKVKEVNYEELALKNAIRNI